MAIQMRRGNLVDFDPSKMLPGEWAVATDMEKLYMCFAPGRVIEVGSAASLVHYIELAEAWAVGTKDGVPVTVSDPTYQNNSKYYAEQAHTSETNASASETNAATSESNSTAWAVGTTDPSHPAYNNSAKDWAASAAAIVGIGVATTSVAGIVKPDGTTITVDGDGTIHANNISIVGKKVVVS